MTSSKLKIAVLYDVWEEGAPEPEPEPEKPVRRKKTKKKTVRKKKKEKHDREEIFEALDKLGHEPSYQVLDGRNQSLARARQVRRRPRLQPHRVLCRRRHEGHEHRRLPRPGSAFLTPAAARRLYSSRRTNPSPRRCSTSTE